jgi:hypothetical protein
MCAVLSVRSQLGSRKAEPIRHRKSKIRGKHDAADGSVLARVFLIRFSRKSSSPK